MLLDACDCPEPEVDTVTDQFPAFWSAVELDSGNAPNPAVGSPNETGVTKGWFGELDWATCNE
jgi:hypothetical protein